MKIQPPRGFLRNPLALMPTMFFRPCLCGSKQPQKKCCARYAYMKKYIIRFLAHNQADLIAGAALARDTLRKYLEHESANPLVINSMQDVIDYNAAAPLRNECRICLIPPDFTPGQSLNKCKDCNNFMVCDDCIAAHEQEVHSA